jgi:hypothetical protein
LDFSQYTREQQLELLDMMEEVARRQRDAQALYAPNVGQLPVHRSRAATRCVFSGNGAGKTTLAAHEALWAALGWNPILEEFTPVPVRVVVVVDHPSKSDDSWIPEIEKWFTIKASQKHKRGTHHTAAVTFPNGSEILFFSHAMDPLVFESIEIDWLICDEPPPRHAYVALCRGGRKKYRKLRVLIAGTPITGRWMRQELWEPWAKGQLPNVECFKYGTKVNEQNLSEGFIGEYGAKLSDKEKRIRLEGEFFDLEGLALAHLFSRETHVIEAASFEWSETAPCVVAIDPHPVKEHHAVMLGVDKEGYRYVLKETKRKMVASQFARHLHDFVRGYRVVDIVCDCLGSQEGTGGDGFKSFIQVLNAEGIQVRATTWDDKQDEDFVERIREDLLCPDKPDNFGQMVPPLRFLSCCLGSIADVENVQWVRAGRMMAAQGEEYKPKLDISNKDFLSCIKYGLASGLTPSSGRASMYVRSRGRASAQATQHDKQRAVRRPLRLRPHRLATTAKEIKWRDW